jgi:hypothetical protein
MDTKLYGRIPHNGVAGSGKLRFHHRNSIVAQCPDRPGMERREILVQKEVHASVRTISSAASAAAYSHHHGGFRFNPCRELHIATLPRAWRAIPPMAIVGGLVLMLGLAGFWYLDRSARQPPPAHESYLKQSVVEITGMIGDAGGRPLKAVELNCVFYDAYGQLVLRERVAIEKTTRWRWNL